MPGHSRTRAPGGEIRSGTAPPIPDRPKPEQRSGRGGTVTKLHAGDPRHGPPCPLQPPDDPGGTHATLPGRKGRRYRGEPLMDLAGLSERSHYYAAVLNASLFSSCLPCSARSSPSASGPRPKSHAGSTERDSAASPGSTGPRVRRRPSPYGLGCGTRRVTLPDGRARNRARWNGCPLPGAGSARWCRRDDRGSAASDSEIARGAVGRIGAPRSLRFQALCEPGRVGQVIGANESMFGPLLRGRNRVHSRPEELGFLREFRPVPLPGSD